MSVLKIKQNGEWIPVGEYPLADVAFSGSYDDLKDLPDLSLSGKSGNGEESVIINGDNVADGDYSIVGGNGNIIISNYSTAVGENNFAGLMAYYIKSIDIVNHKIYLSDIQNVCPEISENDYTDINFETPAYEIGDKFDLIVKAYETYREQFHFISTILKIENNVVYYGADNEGNGAELPITAIYEDTVEYAQTFFVSSKPNIGLVNIGGYSNVEGDSNYASGKWSHAEGWNSLAAGRFSHVEGRDGRSAYAAHAEGYNCNADGNYSHAEGNRTKAKGAYSHSEGKLTTATGNGAHSEGLNSHSSGDNSHAEGEANNAKQKASHAEGLSSIAEGVASHAEGYGSIAKGRGAHSEGGKDNFNNIDSTTAEGDYSHAEGLGSIAKGTASHAENGAKAIAEYSHAEGKGTSNGTNSHAEGSSTSNGTNSHAEGTATIASGKGSHAEGYWTYASSDYQHVQGKYNIEDTENKYAHIVGNGTVSNRSNAHTLDWSGNACYSGDVYVNGADAETGKKLATEEFVNNAVINDSKWTTLGSITLSGTDGGVSANFPCDLNRIREASDLRYIIKAGSYLTGTMTRQDASGDMAIETLKESIYGSSYVILNMIIDGTSQTKGSSETINISEDIIIPLNKAIYKTGASQIITKKISNGEQSITSTFDELIGLKTYTATSSNYMTFEYSFVIELQKR